MRMAQLDNCTRCGVVFARGLRDICGKCYREEEEAFQTVYRFLTKRKNREATINEIVEATKVEEELIIKFMKQKRLRSSQFPKLAYPCEKCGADIVEGRLCSNCSTQIKTDLALHDKMEKRSAEKKEHESIYYTINKENN
ncbi:flagellar operon protein (TIGR03826 family) [Pseudogracilibacillus auburnensis]|uniref:Flagellar operon protein (TIGR03826 family) n=2 Tax=Pseudogracilibacillus auburnensis TaxID=1494959 RepID=A0A2V3W964_9BACI|nr:flagellar operon protein (TIGR03826 family) [Pseudogracilibacillus auburnensis]